MQHTLTAAQLNALRYALNKALDIIGTIERTPARPYTAPTLERAKDGLFSDEVRQATQDRIKRHSEGIDRLIFPHLTHGKADTE